MQKPKKSYDVERLIQSSVLDPGWSCLLCGSSDTVLFHIVFSVCRKVRDNDGRDIEPTMTTRGRGAVQNPRTLLSDLSDRGTPQVITSLH